MKKAISAVHPAASLSLVFTPPFSNSVPVFVAMGPLSEFVRCLFSPGSLSTRNQTTQAEVNRHRKSGEHEPSR
jgi:hypothetical protein